MAVISITEWAKKQGFSRQYAHRLLQSGIIARVDGKIDEAQANAVLAAKREPTRPQQRKGVSLAPPSENSLNQLWMKARIKNELQKGETLAFEARVRKGKMLPVEEVEEAAFRCARVTRDRLLTIPARVCHELASMPDATDIERLLTTEIRQALEQLSHPTFSFESGTMNTANAASSPPDTKGDEERDAINTPLSDDEFLPS